MTYWSRFALFALPRTIPSLFLIVVFSSFPSAFLVLFLSSSLSLFVQEAESRGLLIELRAVVPLTKILLSADVVAQTAAAGALLNVCILCLLFRRLSGLCLLSLGSWLAFAGMLQKV